MIAYAVPTTTVDLGQNYRLAIIDPVDRLVTTETIIFWILDRRVSGLYNLAEFIRMFDFVSAGLLFSIKEFYKKNQTIGILGKTKTRAFATILCSTVQ